MDEDALNDSRVIDRGDELHPPCTARTAQDVQVERSAHERRPRPIAWRAWASAPRLGRCCARIRRFPDIRAAIGDDLRPPPRVWGQHAVVEEKVNLGPRRQDRQLLDAIGLDRAPVHVAQEREGQAVALVKLRVGERRVAADPEYYGALVLGPAVDLAEAAGREVLLDLRRAVGEGLPHAAGVSSGQGLLGTRLEWREGEEASFAEAEMRGTQTFDAVAPFHREVRLACLDGIAVTGRVTHTP